jgi:hypothetical protein
LEINHMGFRTIVALSNDHSSDWNYNPDLGREIMMLGASREDRTGSASRIGLTLVECTHADTQSLFIADGYTAKAVAFSNWHRGQTEEQRDLALLKDLADRLGYRVSKKPTQPTGLAFAPV